MHEVYSKVSLELLEARELIDLLTPYKDEMQYNSAGHDRLRRILNKIENLIISEFV